MAYQESFSQDDEDKKKEQMGATSSEQVLSEGSSSSDQNPMAAPSAAVAKPQSRSGSWTNLTSYIDANKDQAAGMAGTVTSNIDKNASEAGQAGQAYASSVNDEVKKNTVDNTGFVNKVATAPGQVTSDDWAKATAGYQGPSNATGTQAYADTNKKIGDVRNSVDTLGTAEGRQQTVKDTFARPEGYTQGENTLDSYLLSAGGGGQKLNDFQSGFKANNATSGWEGLLSGLGSNIQTAKTNSDTAVKNARSAVDGSIATGTTKYNSAGTQATDANRKIDENIAKIQQDLSSTDRAAREKAYAAYGLNRQEGEALRLRDPSLSTLQLSPTYNTAGDFAGDLDVDALNNLLGIAGKDRLGALSKSQGGGTFSPKDSAAYKALAAQIMQEESAKSGAPNTYLGTGFSDSMGESPSFIGGDSTPTETNQYIPPSVGTLATQASVGSNDELVNGLSRNATITGGGDEDVFVNPNLSSNASTNQIVADGSSSSSLAPGTVDPSTANWLSSLLNAY